MEVTYLFLVKNPVRKCDVRIEHIIWAPDTKVTINISLQEEAAEDGRNSDRRSN